MSLKSWLAAKSFRLTPSSGRARDGWTSIQDGIDRDIGKVNQALLPMLAVALGAAVCKGWGTPAICAILLWSIACLAAGGTLGFLFGIPKSGMATDHASVAARPAEAPHPGAPAPEELVVTGRANTNLEEVSDWLTKIVVGLTLVHWATIRDDVMAISVTMAGTFGANPPTLVDRSFASALIVGFFTLGFLFGYLYTRMFLQMAFARSDPSQLRRFNRVVQEEITSNLADVQTDAQGFPPALPSSQQLKSAERVRQVVPADHPEAVLRLMREFAAEYETIRTSMEGGRDRTRKMSGVVQRMTPLALAAAPYIEQFVNSASSGERLVAVVILKVVRVDLGYTEWLVRRLVDDPPFIGYQAAAALLGKVRLLGGDAKANLQTLVAAAQDELKAKNLVDPNRDFLLDEILKS